MEKARLPSPAEHPSYLRHRRELWTKILVPMLVAVLIIVAIATIAGVAAFQPASEVGRWAAISTIWIVIPAMCAGLIVLILFIGIVYGMARLLQLIPPYSDQAQKFIWRVQGYIQRGTDAIVNPVISTGGFFATIKRLFGGQK